MSQEGFFSDFTHVSFFKDSRRHFTRGSTGFNGNSTSTASSATDTLFRYTISAAFEPKNRLKDEAEEGELIRKSKKHITVAGSNAIDSPTGEDNFVMAVAEDGTAIVGVADGVGGWSEQGYDSSAISRKLCRCLEEVFLALRAKREPIPEPRKLLSLAFEKVKDSGEVEVGSTTVCYGTIDEYGALKVANLGDSWFGVFRQDEAGVAGSRFKCVSESTEQTYYFNAPYQLSIIPERILDAGKKRQANYLRNEPAESDVYEQQLQRGDVVVFGTDGVGDNVSVADIELYLTDSFAPFQDSSKDSRILYDKAQLEHINSKFVKAVKTLSNDIKYPSVFSQRLSEVTGQPYIGGKPDDITSVIVYVD
ncbi:unnamed protein product [Kuraishia capsulata CBS 1993]|uniref:Protein phosphatase n=1 Tax=Kuraishia capsulata CBS 1993 TaxID=1382522 RepID=W6ML51_9ASCO|nr:uncharacterized protein KUCA_T00002797001 [Kuraishia capsulata CBS 1993]CDK26823.1 unnamed protein product [Kuraishia capsulata CBS 1993]